MGRVFVTQEPRTIRGRAIDLTPAMEHGDVVFLLSKTVNVLDAAFAVRQIAANLREFNRDDFILPLGDPVAIAIAASLAAKLSGGEYTILKWDRQEEKYYPIHVNINASSL
jgi:hypothetical protein